MLFLNLDQGKILIVKILKEFWEFFSSLVSVRAGMIYMDPSLENAKREIDVVESYASDCWNIGLNTIWDSLDIFAFAHFWGWGMKALMIRNYGICWVISVTWEVGLSLRTLSR